MISRGIGISYKLQHYATRKILTNVYYAIIYPFLLYGITIWGSASNTLLIPLHILQKKFVRLATFNDTYPVYPLTHTPPLFHKLNLLTIFDIYKLQVGKLVYDSPNNIGPTKSIIQFTRAIEVHTHSTHNASLGNFFNSWVRTTRFGLKNLQVEGGHLWATLPNNIKESPSRIAFVRRLKHKLINCYPIQ